MTDKPEDWEGYRPERPELPEATYEENTPEELAEPPSTEPPTSEPYVHRPVESYYHPVTESPSKFIIENWPDATEEERINIAFDLGMKRGRINQKRLKTESSDNTELPIERYFEAIEEAGRHPNGKPNWTRATKIYNEKNNTNIARRTFENRIKRFNTG